MFAQPGGRGGLPRENVPEALGEDAEEAGR